MSRLSFLLPSHLPPQLSHSLGGAPFSVGVDTFEQANLVTSHFSYLYNAVIKLLCLASRVARSFSKHLLDTYPVHSLLRCWGNRSEQTTQKPPPSGAYVLCRVVREGLCDEMQLRQGVNEVRLEPCSYLRVSGTGTVRTEAGACAARAPGTLWGRRGVCAEQHSRKARALGGCPGESAFRGNGHPSVRSCSSSKEGQRALPNHGMYFGGTVLTHY